MISSLFFNQAFCGVYVTESNWRSEIRIPIKARDDLRLDGDKSRNLLVSVAYMVGTTVLSHQKIGTVKVSITSLPPYQGNLNNSSLKFNYSYELR